MRHGNPTTLGRTTDTLRERSVTYEFWLDPLRFGNWFTDGGVGAFGNIYFANWVRGTGMRGFDSATSQDFGISSLYVGDRAKADTILAFTFYEGRSGLYLRPVASRYVTAEPVRGLFDIALDIKHFHRIYFEHILDSLGYGHACNLDVTHDCMIEDGGREGVTILRTNDPAVIIAMDPKGEKLHIRLVSYLSTLTEAMVANLHKRYEEIRSANRKALE
jgi:hypothetical protein